MQDCKRQLPKNPLQDCRGGIRSTMLDAAGFEFRPWVQRTAGSMRNRQPAFGSCCCSSVPYEEQQDDIIPSTIPPTIPPQTTTTNHVPANKSGVQHSSPELDRTVDMSVNASRFYSPDPNETSVSFVRPPTRRLFPSSQKKQQHLWVKQHSIEGMSVNRSNMNLSVLSNLSEKEAVGWCFENVMEQIKANQSTVTLRKTSAPWMVREKENIANSPSRNKSRRKQRSPLEQRFMQAYKQLMVE